MRPRAASAHGVSIEMPFALRELGERAALVVVARLRPRIDRAVAQRPAGVRNDQRLVVLERRAESVAALDTRRAGC